MSSSPGSFVAIDGEGAGNDPHRYFLLCSSSGSSAYRKTGLSTATALDFLLDTRAENRKSTLVGFGFNYDVNMILADLERDAIAELWETGKVEWFKGKRRFGLEYIPSKFLAVYNGGVQAKVYDAWGFFQSSFLRALDDWTIGTDDERREIEQRKGERADFDVKDLAIIRHYCLLECRLLVDLMDALRASLDTAGLVPAAWYGPGAVASKLLGKTVRPDHRHDDHWPDGVKDAIMRAYFGGRVEVFLQGELENVTTYDLRSAYPRATQELPVLTGGRWTYRKQYDPAEPFALWRCNWNLPGELVCPFPVRVKRSIFYPVNGRGWYHAAEVAAALELYPAGVDVEHGYTFEAASDRRPFDFVPDFYRLRRELKERGDAAEYAYKLALNSLYGKLAQGLGYAGKLPAFQSYAWAGAITAWTRSRLLEMMGLAPRHVVFTATDAVAFSGDPQLSTSSELGGLDRTEWAHMFIAQAGIYWATDAAGGELERSRGFFVRDLDFPTMLAHWRREGRYGSFQHTTRRFIGMGSALGRSDFDVWRSWVDEPRELSFFAARKFYDETADRRKVERLHPPAFETIVDSDPYTPKQGHIDKGAVDDEYLAGIEQPRILE